MSDELMPMPLNAFRSAVVRRNNKPEQNVLDDIEELVNEELTHTPDDYTKNNERYVKCELCHGNWHGLANPGGCPGAYATVEQHKRWLESPTGTGVYVGCLTTEYQGALCDVHLYRDDDHGGGYVGLLMTPTEADDSRGLDCDLYTFDEARATLTLHLADEEFELPITYVPQPISDQPVDDDTP